MGAEPTSGGVFRERLEASRVVTRRDSSSQTTDISRITSEMIAPVAIGLPKSPHRFQRLVDSNSGGDEPASYLKSS